LREYEAHLLIVAGLAESTAYYRLRHARDLLQHFKVQRASQLRGWEATELADYVARTGRQWKPRWWATTCLISPQLPQVLAVQGVGSSRSRDSDSVLR
jgi:hypothetical protein